MGDPSFMVVGAQKAGTTWLFECLNEHPEIFVAPQKETHFFCPAGLCRVSTRSKGLAWYRGLFPDGGYRALGDVSTDYMAFEGVAAELAAFDPGLRIVFLLREPVDRAYSAYWMERKYKPGLPPFEQALDARPGYIARGLYHQQIERFRRHFPDRQLRVYVYEEATADPEAFLADLFGFLGVDPEFRPATARRRVANSTQMAPWAGWLVYKVAAPLIRLPLVLPLWRLLRRRTGLREWLLGLLARRPAAAPGHGASGYEPLASAVRLRVARHFEAENRRLYALLGREIPAWESPRPDTAARAAAAAPRRSRPAFASAGGS